jgi:VanZ family protein
MTNHRRINWPLISLTMLVLYWAALAVATHLPAVVVPRTRLTDKSIHFFAFFGLSVLLGAAWASRRPWGLQAALSVVTTIAVYAALDELTQGLIPGRYPDLRDWYYDVGGAVAGVVLLSLGNAVWQLVRRSPPQPQT